MANQENPTPTAQNREAVVDNGEKNNETPRPKTPLEKVREGQARMRGQKLDSGRGSQEGETASSANSYKRRQHQRKAG
jgi:hypothetical protein